jgi:hypothetical protein
MSINPEVDGIVVLPVPDEPVEAGNGHAWPASVELAPAAELAPAVAPAARARRPRPAWIVPAAIAAVGLIVSGTLGYVLYTTIQQRDGLHQQLVSTKTTLATTQDQVTAAQADAKSKKVTADYVALYVADEGKVLTSYENTVVCSGYSQCRSSAQQFLTDMQTFQADRKSANVPFALESQDGSLGDALSAAIAGDQELITGMDNGDIPKIDDGGAKVDAAMLNLAKAEAAMGTQLR